MFRATVSNASSIESLHYCQIVSQRLANEGGKTGDMWPAYGQLVHCLSPLCLSSMSPPSLLEHSFRFDWFDRRHKCAVWRLVCRSSWLTPAEQQQEESTPAKQESGASQLTSCDQPSLHLAIGHQAQSASNLPLAVSDINLDAMGSDSKHPK